MQLASELAPILTRTLAQAVERTAMPARLPLHPLPASEPAPTQARALTVTFTRTLARTSKRC
eukprot:6724179-Alexandrium_andersonii.AAC.1